MELTRETPAPGLCVWQPRRGYRYGSEAFWLAGFAIEVGVPTRALDLGTGSGIAALLLASRGVHALGLDLLARWSPCWERTIEESRVRGTVRFAVRDVADMAPGAEGLFDLVVSNPPFFPAGTGPVAADPIAAAARTESTASLAAFVRAAAGSLAEGGRACFVIPDVREKDLGKAATEAGLGVARIARVGRRRLLAELGPPGHRVRSEAVLRESDARVLGWYATFGAAPPP